MTEFLYLGSWKKIFTSRLDEECLAGLRHIYTEWSNLTCGDRDIQWTLDKETVVLLEGCTPAASPLDRRAIREGFGTNQALVGVTDVQRRREIERRALAAPGMIPGLRLLQQNMIYLGIAAEILWSHVIPKDARTAKRNLRKTLRATLRGHWVETAPYVEIHEGVFRPARGPPSFDLAYTQLVLAALRQFPYLSFERPKTEGGPKPLMSFDPKCVALLHRRAKLLGFRSSAIDAGAARQSSPFQPQSWTVDLEVDAFNESGSHQRAECQWGKPCTDVYRTIQTSAFLPTMHRAPEDQMDVLYGLRAMLRACFVPCRYELDLGRPMLFINENRPTQHVTADAAPNSPQRQLCRSCLRYLEEWTDGVYDGNLGQTMAPFSASAVDVHDDSLPPDDLASEGLISHRSMPEELNHDQPQNPFAFAARVNQTILSDSSVYSRGPDTDIANMSASSLEHRLGDSPLSLPIHLLQFSSPDTSPHPDSSSPVAQQCFPAGQTSLDAAGRMPPLPDARDRQRQCDAKDRSGHGSLSTKGKGKLSPRRSARPRSPILGTRPPSASCRVTKLCQSHQRPHILQPVRGLAPNSKRRDATSHGSSPSHSADSSPLAASPVRPRSKVPSTRPHSPTSRVTKRSRNRQVADRSHTIERLSPDLLAQSTSNHCSSTSQPNNGSERPRSEIPPTRSPSAHSRATKLPGYYERPDGLRRFKKHSPRAVAQFPRRGSTDFRRSPSQPASESSLIASPVRPRSEVPIAVSSSASPRFTKRSRSHQRFDGLQANGGVSPGTFAHSESGATTGCWSWSSSATRSTPPHFSSGQWERRPSGYPRDMANAPLYRHGSPPREAYGQLSGTQGFEDSEEDFVSVNLNE
ncbi:hypothetical protein JDV02_001893 [Purpureocillium takamizusanense]|nr:uncharacterized protein JDV02_001893 [Purpureocillium takamizusanense]UNI15355.1 hypothetical protein JDV02_001893 [Purpureocillium takamizusanense]